MKTFPLFQIKILLVNYLFTPSLNSFKVIKQIKQLRLFKQFLCNETDCLKTFWNNLNNYAFPPNTLNNHNFLKSWNYPNSILDLIKSLSTEAAKKNLADCWIISFSVTKITTNSHRSFLRRSNYQTRVMRNCSAAKFPVSTFWKMDCLEMTKKKKNLRTENIQL